MYLFPAMDFVHWDHKSSSMLVVHDLSFLHFPSFNKKSHALFYKRYTPKFLEKAKGIATVSEFSKQDILLQYKKIDPSKIDVVYSGVKEIFQSIDVNEKDTDQRKIYWQEKNISFISGQFIQEKI